RDMICNPVYCLDRVAPWIAEPPEPLVPVEQWVAAGAKLIEEIGAATYVSSSKTSEENSRILTLTVRPGPVFDRLTEQLPEAISDYLLSVCTSRSGRMFVVSC